MSRSDGYLIQVMDEIPLPHPERERIARDLRAHLQESVEARGDESEALRSMGAPEAVARAYLAEEARPVASVPQRVLAFILDVALGIAVMLVVGGTIAALMLVSGQATIGSEPTPSLAVAAILFVATLSLLSIAYFPLMEWRLSQTVGKKIVGVHVAREDGRRIGLGQAIVRRIPFFLEFFWIDAIVALFTERKQRAFDLVAGTVVLRTPAVPESAPVAGRAPEAGPSGPERRPDETGPPGQEG